MSNKEFIAIAYVCILPNFAHIQILNRTAKYFGDIQVFFNTEIPKS